MHRTIFFILSLFGAFICASNTAFAQQIPSEGRDFYLGMLFPSYNNVVPKESAAFFKAYAIISSYQDNVVSISYFDLTTGIEETPVKYVVKKGQAVQIQLDPPKLRMQDPGDQVKEYRSVHITAEKPIGVTYFSTGPSSCGSYLALTTGCLGKKYVVASYNDNPDGENALVGGSGPATADVACGYFMVIGVYDGTLVTITPTSTTQGGKHTGVMSGPGADGKPHPYTISLNHGQCYMVKSWCQGPDNDITGSIVESNKPVAVLGGHEDAALGDLSGRHLEGRDYMVEQMIPVDYWDTTGYVSMPLVDSSPLGPSDTQGDNYRVYTYDSLAKVQMTIASLSGSVDMSTSRFTSKERFEVEVPVHVYSSDGHKFGVMLYDQTNQSTSAPFPRPSMMTIIPMSRWKNSYLWHVPKNETTEVFQSYYVNIIAPKAKFDSILVARDGFNLAPISSLGPIKGQYNSFPDHPELKGVRYMVYPGNTYYAHANFPFVVYSYGYQAVDFDSDLGDFDADDYFYEYANPVGLSGYAGNSPKIKVSVDSGCGSWQVTVTDQNPGGGIRSISLLDDPGADIIIPPSGHAPYQYVNCAFDKVHDPLGIREINLPGTDTTVAFTIAFEDISKPAYAPIYIVSSSGTQLVELKGSATDVTFFPSGSPTLEFIPQKYKGTKDTTIVFTNNATSSKNYTVLSVNLAHPDSVFAITSVTPSLPALIKPGEQLVIGVRYTTKDTLLHQDTAVMVTDCFTRDFAIMARSGAPIIYANDIMFGSVPIDSVKCIDTLRVRNIGTVPFTLDKNFLLSDTLEFSMSATSLAELPKVLDPGESITLTICYHPRNLGSDSVVLLWKTSTDSSLTLSGKSYSILKAKGVEVGFEWDRDTAFIPADSTKELVQRVYLKNNSDLKVRVRTVFIEGLDASEFRVVASQPGTLNLFDVPGSDSVWFDIGFKIDMTKPISVRHARLIASNDDIGIIDSMELIGAFGIQSEVKNISPFESISIHPNPSSGKNMTAEFTLPNNDRLEFLIFDILGREVLRLDSKMYAAGRNSVELPVGKLPPGSYHLRISSDEGVVTRMIEVVR